MADTLLSEIDQALRAERAGTLWARYRTAVVAVAVAIVLGVAAKAGWQAYREAKGGAVLIQLTEAQQLLEGGKQMDAAKAFGDIAAQASGEFKHLALVWQSRALVNAGKKEEAIAPLKAAVADGSSLWADIACLRLAGLDAAAADGCLAATTNSPLAAARAEWSAANLWAKGDVAGAKAAIEKILADKETNPDTQARLTQWLSIMNTPKVSE
jgi:hypothetical protein